MTVTSALAQRIADVAHVERELADTLAAALITVPRESTKVITLKGEAGAEGGTSRKMTNVLVNWKELITRAIPSAINMASGDDLTAILISCMECFASLYSLREVSLSPTHARVIATLAAQSPGVTSTTLLEFTGGDQNSLDEVVADLQRFRMIERQPDQTWVLVEEVSFQSPPAR